MLVNGGFETGDLSGWSAAGVNVEQLFLGGEFGNYGARIHNGALQQSVATVAGQHYTLSFQVAGDADATSSDFHVFWDGIELNLPSGVGLAYTQYTFDVVGDASSSSTLLSYTFSTDGSGQLLDTISVAPTPGPAVETTDGSIAFSDIETADTHTASVTALGSGYVGTFSVDPVSEASGSGTVAWHYTVDNADIQFLAQGLTLVQTHAVSIVGDHGASTVQNVSIAISGTNDAPTAVGETVISDVGGSGTVDIPAWALALNDTDPDATDHVFVNSIGDEHGRKCGSVWRRLLR